MTDCVTSVVLSSVHKSRSVVKCFLGVRRTGPKSRPFVSPSGKVMRLFASISYAIRWCCSPGHIAPCPLGKLYQNKFVYLDLKLENPRTLGSANPCLSLLRTSGSVNPLFGHPRTLRRARLAVCFLRALCKYEPWRF